MIAVLVMAEGKNKVAIGYPVFFQGYEAVANFMEPRYKVGAALDLYLRDRYGITNTDRCAEGISPEDEYRIVQTNPTPSQIESNFRHFDVSSENGFRVVNQFGIYQVLEKAGAAVSRNP